jgi:hypothetical protein
MGLGLSQLQVNLELYKNGFFSKTNNIIELGSQEIKVSSEDLSTLFKSLKIEGDLVNQFLKKNLYPEKCLSSKHFYECLGIYDYKCVDISGEHNSIDFDLNYPLEKAELSERLKGHFDLVTDYGSSEHVFNNVEAFKTMHDLCKQNGLIIISQAIFGGNGYYHYDNSFFDGIALFNNYEIIISCYNINSDKKINNNSVSFNIPSDKRILNFLNLNFIDTLGILYVFRKKNSDDFKFPYQDSFASEKLNCYYFSKIYNNDLSYSYLPSTTSNLKFKDYLKIILKKIFKKIFLR